MQRLELLLVGLHLFLLHVEDLLQLFKNLQFVAISFPLRHLLLAL